MWKRLSLSIPLPYPQRLIYQNGKKVIIQEVEQSKNTVQKGLEQVKKKFKKKEEFYSNLNNLIVRDIKKSKYI